VRITAHDNALLMRLRRLGSDGSAYRRVGQVWLEGDHLCRALQQRAGAAACAVLSDSGADDPALRALAGYAARTVLVSDALFASISTLESPARIGFVLDLAASPTALPGVASLVLDRVQDAGNAGSMLRSAAAFGVQQVVALKGTVALWSPKVLRAGMGAHFALRLVEAGDSAALQALQVPLVATSSHAGVLLPQAALPSPCAWVLGHEGQGVSPELLAACALQVRIPQPGGEESLNVAAAAAVCLYASYCSGALPAPCQ
jgi:TrmH family RNA methyltransferase